MVTIIDKQYMTPVGEFNKVIIENEHAIRLVLTGKCNLNCEFCIYKSKNFYSAEVESDELTDMTITNELKRVLEELKNRLNYNVVHLTGGEPTLCKDIKEIAFMIKSINSRVHIISNLINIDVIKQLANDSLIQELTFSYVPLDKADNNRNESLKGYKTSDNDRNELIKRNVTQLIQRNLDMSIKANIVISGLSDLDDCISFIEWCWRNGVSPRLQRDRSSDRIHGSTNAVNQIIARLGMEPQLVRLRVPGATEICEFKREDGKEIKIKVFNQNFRFESICDKCDKVYSCDKALSSIRIFNKNKGVRLSLCTKLDSNFTTISIEDFLESKVSSDIYFYKRYHNEYFNKYCRIKNHQ